MADTPTQEQAPDGQTETSQVPGTVTLAAAEVDELRRKAGERDEYLDLARRTQAEFQNYQKRQQRERDQERDYFRGGLVLELLPVLDNLERAINSARQSGGDSLLKGVQMVQTQFVELLRQRFNVTRVEAVGQPFDPAVHEALTQQPSEQHAPDTVIQVVENGYKMGDRTLRPAKVIVAAKP